MVVEDLTKEEFFTEEDDALTLDDLKVGYIGNPAVGDNIQFTVKKIVKLTGTKLIAKKTDGSTFKKNLSNVDYGYEIHTDDGHIYTVSAWEVFGKLKGIFQKLKTIEGAKVKIHHIKDGMQDKNGDSYKVEAEVDGKWKVLNRETKKWE